MQISIIFNPTAGHRSHKRLDAVVEALSKRGAVVNVMPTQKQGDAQAFAAAFASDAHQETAHRLAVAGGDGTINEAFNGLVLAGGGALGIIPMGTANVLALEMGLTADPAHIAGTLLTGAAQPIALGRAGERVFFLMAGAGFDSHVVASVSPALKRLFGKGAYVWSAVTTWVRGGLPRYEAAVDGVSYEAASVIVTNAKRYAGPYVLAPNADLASNTFEVCLMTESTRGAQLSYGLALLRQRLGTHRSVTFVKGRHVSIRTLTYCAAPVQLDGDAFGTTPLDIQLLEGKASLYVPLT